MKHFVYNTGFINKLQIPKIEHLTIWFFYFSVNMTNKNPYRMPDYENSLVFSLFYFLLKVCFDWLILWIQMRLQPTKMLLGTEEFDISSDITLNSFYR